MTIVHNYFDKIHTTECNYGEPIFELTRVVIPACHLGVMPGHPLNTTNELILLPKCRLIFKGVKSSVRELTEWVGEPKRGHFEPPKTVIDGPFLEVTEPVKLFGIEGYLEKPLAWIDWEIESVSFHLEI